MMECIMTIDLGTTACKVSLFNEMGEMVQCASVDYPTWRPDVQRAEQHPEDWWDAVSYAVRKALTIDPPVEVRAIALSSQRETIVPVDQRGRPLFSALVWMDTRGLEYVRQWADYFGDQLQDWTGLVPSASYSAGKIRWLREHYPELMKECHVFLQPRDYLLMRMTGEIATDYSLASRTLLLNVRQKRWQPELLEQCGISEEQLPPMYPASTILGGLRAEVASQWGLSPGLPIILGGGDRACEVLGAGLKPGEVMESTGTTSNVACSVQDLPLHIDRRVIVSIHVVEGQWLLEQGMSASGAVLNWWRNVLGQKEAIEELGDDGLRSCPGASGLMVLPFFMGARAPRWEPHTRGAIIGLSLSHRTADITRAMMEGIAYELKYSMRILEEMGLFISSVRVVGGGSRSIPWNQIKADIYGCPVRVPKIFHAASYGAFLLAAHQLGWIKSYEDLVNPIQSIYCPSPQVASLYQDGFQLYTFLNECLQEFWERFHAYHDQHFHSSS